MTTSPATLHAIGISGSPSPNSRSRILLDHTLAQLATLGVTTHLLDLSELPAAALLARQQDAAVDAAVQQATQAQILLLGTPIYRATYAGQLKAFLDLFPQAALLGRVTGLIATGASPLHALAIDHGLRPLVASLAGLTAAQAVYVTDAQFPDKAQLPEAVGQLTQGLAQELVTLAKALTNK